MTGPASALAEQSAAGNLMLFPPSNMPMTRGLPAPASQQTDRKPTRPGSATGLIEPPASTLSPVTAAAPSAEKTPLPQKRTVLRQRHYARHWRRPRIYRHDRHYAGRYYAARHYAGAYAPSPLGILALPFVAAQHLLGQ